VSAAGVIVLLALTASTVLGYRALVVRSDSMAPTLRTGDVILTRLQRPSAVEPGDVVTFADPTRDNRLITHRVVEQERVEGEMNFVTQGDANTGLEQWSIPTSGKLGAMVYRLPRLGVPIEGIFSPWMRLVILTVTAMMAAALALRRIWAW
jgi:signal peptidase